MLDWKQAIQDIKFRLKELSTCTPDTLRGEALLAGAGAKSNQLGAKTRELIALAVAVTTRCDGCIAFHAAEAVKLGVSNEPDQLQPQVKSRPHFCSRSQTF